MDSKAAQPQTSEVGTGIAATGRAAETIQALVPDSSHFGATADDVAVQVVGTKRPLLNVHLPNASSFLRELAELAADEVRRLCRYTVKNNICSAEGYGNDTEERASRNIEEMLNRYFDKMGDYVDFAVRHCEEVIKEGGARCVDSNDLTRTILQRQLRRSIDHARELGDRLENSERKGSEQQHRFWDLRRMYFMEVQSLRSRCRYLQQTVLKTNPDDTILSDVKGGGGFDEEVVFWNETAYMEPWMRELLQTQAADLKAQMQIQKQMSDVMLENARAKRDEAVLEKEALQDQLANLKSKFQLQQMRLAVSKANVARLSNAVGHGGDEDMMHGISVVTSPDSSPLTHIGEEHAAPPMRKAHRVEDVENVKGDLKALHNFVEEGSVKLNALRELHDHWGRRLAEAKDDHAAKETSQNMINQMRERMDRINTEFRHVSSTKDALKSEEHEPWQRLAELTDAHEKMKNENVLLNMEKQQLQTSVQKAREEPDKLRKQLRQANAQVETHELDMRREMKLVGELTIDKEKLEDQVKSLMDQLLQCGAQLEEEKRKLALKEKSHKEAMQRALKGARKASAEHVSAVVHGGSLKDMFKKGVDTATDRQPSVAEDKVSTSTADVKSNLLADLAKAAPVAEGAIDKKPSKESTGMETGFSSDSDAGGDRGERDAPPQSAEPKQEVPEASARAVTNLESPSGLSQEGKRFDHEATEDAGTAVVEASSMTHAEDSSNIAQAGEATDKLDALDGATGAQAGPAPVTQAGTAPLIPDSPKTSPPTSPASKASPPASPSSGRKKLHKSRQNTKNNVESSSSIRAEEQPPASPPAQSKIERVKTVKRRTSQEDMRCLDFTMDNVRLSAAEQVLTMQKTKSMPAPSSESTKVPESLPEPIPDSMPESPARDTESIPKATHTLLLNTALEREGRKWRSFLRRCLGRVVDIPQNAIAIVKRLEAELRAEIEKRAFDGCWVGDDEPSSDEENGNYARFAVMSEVEEVGDVDFGDLPSLRAREVLPPLPPALHDSTLCDDMMALPVEDFVSPWLPLPQLQHVHEVEFVTRSTCEDLERSADARFKRLQARLAEIDDENTQKASSLTERSVSAALQRNVWTPPRTPSPHRSRRGAHKLDLSADDLPSLCNDSVTVDEQTSGENPVDIEDECSAAIAMLGKLMQQALHPDDPKHHRPARQLSSKTLPDLRSLHSNDVEAVVTNRIPKRKKSLHKHPTGKLGVKPSISSKKNSMNRVGRSASKAGNGSRNSSRPVSPSKFESGISADSTAEFPSEPSEIPGQDETNDGDESERLSFSRSATSSMPLPSVTFLEPEAPTESDAPEQAPGSDQVDQAKQEMSDTVMRSVVALVQRQGTSNLGLEAIADLLTPDSKVEICKGFLEALGEHETLVAQANARKQAQQREESMRRKQHVDVATKQMRVMRQVPHADAECQVNMQTEERLRKELGTQTDAPLSERDESSRRLQLNEAAVKLLAQRLEGSLIDALPAVDSVAQLGNAESRRLEVDNNSESNQGAGVFDSLMRNGQLSAGSILANTLGAQPDERAAFASLAASMLLWSGQPDEKRHSSRHSSRNVSRTGSRLGLNQSQSNSRRHTTVLAETRRASFMSTHDEEADEDGGDQKRTSLTRSSVARRNDDSELSSRNSIQHGIVEDSADIMKRRNAQHGKITRVGMVEEDDVACDEQSDAAMCHQSALPTYEAADSPLRCDNSSFANASAQRQSKHLENQRLSMASLKSHESEAFNGEFGSEFGDLGEPSTTNTLLDLLGNMCTEVVNCGQTTELVWESLPGCILAWLKVNLMQRQQAKLYCTTWAASELEDFPSISVLERERLVKDFESFLLHIMCLVPPNRATEQRRALRKQYRNNAMGPLAKAIEGLDPESSKPTRQLLSEIPAIAPIVIQSVDNPVLDDEKTTPSSLLGRTVGTVTSGTTIGSGVPQGVKRGIAFVKTASDRSLHSDATAITRTLSIVSSAASAGAGNVDEEENEDANEFGKEDALDMFQQRRILGYVPDGMSHSQAVVFRLSSLLGFDVSGSPPDVQQDVFCAEYFTSQEKMANHYQQKLQELSPCDQEAFDAGGPFQRVPSVSGTSHPSERTDLESRPSVVDSISEAPIQERALLFPDLAQEVASTIPLVRPALEQSDTVVAVGGGPAAAQALLRSPLKRAGTLPWSMDSSHRPLSNSHMQFEQNAKKARLFMQRMEALRPYHVFGPIPQGIVNALRQLDDIEKDVNVHMSVLKGTTHQQQQQLADCVEPLLRRISAAVEHKWNPESDGKKSSAQSNSIWMTEVERRIEVARQLAVGRETDSTAIQWALDGLCNSAAKREKMRLALLRYGFAKVRRCCQAPKEEIPKPPSSAPARLRSAAPVAAPTSVGGTLGACAREDSSIASQRSPDQRRPWTSGLAHLARRPVEPSHEEFVGAVAWNYASLNSHSVGRAPSSRADWKFRPVTAPTAQIGHGGVEVPSNVPYNFEGSEDAGLDETFGRQNAMRMTLSSTTPEGTDGHRRSASGMEIFENGAPTPKQNAMATLQNVMSTARSPKRHIVSVTKNGNAASPVRHTWQRRSTQHTSPIETKSPEASNIKASAEKHPATDTPPTASVFAGALVRAPNRGKLGPVTPRRAAASG